MENYIMRTYWDYKIVNEVLDYMEFELLISKNEDGETILKLHDLTGANLADIESEEFTDFEDVMARLSGAYCKDYFEDSLVEEFENEIQDWVDYSDFYKQIMNLPYDRIKNCLWHINVLGLFGYVYDEMGS